MQVAIKLIAPVSIGEMVYVWLEAVKCFDVSQRVDLKGIGRTDSMANVQAKAAIRMINNPLNKLIKI